MSKEKNQKKTSYINIPLTAKMKERIKIRADKRGTAPTTLCRYLVKRGLDLLDDAGDI